MVCSSARSSARSSASYGARNGARRGARNGARSGARSVGPQFFCAFYQKSEGFGTRTDRGTAVFSHPNSARKPP